MSKVIWNGEEDECWTWIASLDSSGYGHIRLDGKLCKASRIAWELENGSIPAGVGYHGICVLHRCDNPPCVNPAHLFLGTQTENMRDAKRKKRRASQAGDANANAKLTPDKVFEIRMLYKRGAISQQALGQRFGIAQSQVSQIVRQAQWLET